jgi:hypothetical protein
MTPAHGRRSRVGPACNGGGGGIRGHGGWRTSPVDECQQVVHRERCGDGEATAAGTTRLDDSEMPPTEVAGELKAKDFILKI